MIRSYLKTAFRFLLKNKTFSFINIFGLAVGTLCCLYILLYVQDQFSYDKQHQNAENIYRVNTDLALTGDRHHNASTSPPIAPAIKRDFPEVQQFTRHVGIGGKNLLKYKEQSFCEEHLAYVDSTFFNVFSYHFVAGNNTAGLLAQPYSIVLLKSVADKLFGNDDPINKVISISNQDGKHDFRVAAVVDNSLGKSVLEDHIFVTMRSGGTGQFVLDNTAWAGYNFTDSFIKLRPGADPGALEKKFPDFLNKYGAQQLKQLGMTKQLHLQQISTIHTTTGYENEPGKTVSPMLLYILAGIAIMIQLIACINFMNLSTARASKRAKEVGVRKVVGAGRGDLIKQFLGESFLLTLIGVLLALPLLYLLLPLLNQITQTSIQASFLSNGSVWLMLVAIVVVTGVLAGSYPAFYLSAFEAIKVMKGNFTSQISASGIRRSLVIFQFVLSIILITGIIIIYSQLNFIKN
ncbi:MAG TPA: ABC transporter permease, partial [Mucilaginibacter sp.]